MSPLKRVNLFFLLCLVFYGLLIIPWPGLMDGYRALFRAGGNVIFHSFGSGGSVSFKPLSSADHSKDTTIVLMKKSPPPARGEMDINVTYGGYRPTAFLIALVLATPIPWSRRWRALLLGLALVSAFVALRVTLRVLDAFSDPNALALYAFSPFWKGMLKVMIKILVLAPAGHYMVPAFIWLLVSFRRGDVDTILGTRQGSKPAKRGKKSHPAMRKPT